MTMNDPTTDPDRPPDLPLDREIVSYLLGDLPEPAAGQLEDRFVSDPELFEHLQAVEADLVDAYVSGTLPPADRVRLEERLLPSAEGRAKIAFARALHERATATAERARRRWWRPLAAAFVLAAAAVLLLVLRPAPESLVLQPDTVRSSPQVPTVEIPARGLALSLVVDPAEPARAFEARLTRDGTVRWTGRVSREGSEPVELVLPAEELQQPGRYRLELHHPEGQISYPFRLR